MQLIAPTTLAALSLLTLAPSAFAETCTKEQETQFSQLTGEAHTVCSDVMLYFSTCDDSCLAIFKNVVTKAPTCTRTSTTFLDDPDEIVTQCETYRANNATKYAPKLTPGLAKCTPAENSKWREDNGVGTAYSKCTLEKTGDECSDDCLKTIESGVDKTAQCLSNGNYTMREFKKKDLVSCLKARGTDLKTNTVLQSAGSSSGKSSAAATTTSAPSATTASSASTVAASVLAIGITVVSVAASMA